MIKVNKKLILMLILVLIVGILSGCEEQKKAPEGMSQQFYDDMTLIGEDLAKTIKTAKNFHSSESDILNNEGYKLLEQYSAKKDELNNIETLTLEAMFYLYFSVADYYDVYHSEDYDYKLDTEKITDTLNTLNTLMETDVDIKEIILK